jgi:hypothetical protein
LIAAKLIYFYNFLKIVLSFDMFREYVFNVAMQKLSPEARLAYIRQIIGQDVDYNENDVLGFFSAWLFQISGEVAQQWNAFVAANDLDTLEILITDFQTAVSAQLLANLEGAGIHVEQTDEWSELVTRIYIEVFEDYINISVPNFVLAWKSFVERFNYDEGIDEDII